MRRGYGSGRATNKRCGGKNEKYLILQNIAGAIPAEKGN
jgi:hypothetical protein